MRRSRLFLYAVLGSILLFAACEDDNAFFDPAATSDGIDREAILNDVTEVRALLMNVASNFSIEVISDAQFQDNQLTVTVTEEVDGLAEAEELCRDLSEAIAATDVSIEVVDEQGASLATCRFQA